MAKVILFYPKLSEEIGGDKRILLPMSVLMVAAPLVKNGIEVKIIDQRLTDNWKEVLLDELKKNPLVVGFSVLTGEQILYALEASKMVKENSKSFVIWGGVHVSLLPEQTLENKLIDYLVIREGDVVFLDLYRALDGQQSISNVKGIAYRKDGQICINPPQNFISLDDLLPIPYYLVDVEKYVAKKVYSSGKPGREINFYTSRGCPHNCAFCYNQYFNLRRWRGESAEKVIQRIEGLIEKYQITSLNIQDDEFFVDINRAKKICQLIKERNIKVEIASCCRVDYIYQRMDDNFLKLLYEAGFRTLFLGIESGSSRLQEMIHKKITDKEALTVLKRLQQAKINAKLTFMVGFPTETIEDMYKTLDLIWEIKKHNPYSRIPPWRVFVPYPGTEFYQLSIKEGFQVPKSLEEWAKYDFDNVQLSWINKKKKKIINNVSFFIHYLNVRDKKLKFSFKHFLLNIYSATVDFRWRHHLFSFCPEKAIIKLFS